MLSCGKTCICDVFSFAKYSYSLQGTSTIPFQRKMNSNELKKLEDLIAPTMEKSELIKPEKPVSILETRRNI